MAEGGRNISSMIGQLNELRIDSDGFDDVTMQSICSDESTNKENILTMCLICKKSMHGTHDHVSKGFLSHVCDQQTSTDDFFQGMHMTINALQLKALNPIRWPSCQNEIRSPAPMLRLSSIRMDSDQIPDSTQNLHGLVTSTPKRDDSKKDFDAVGYV